ncbi:MAG TPA: hypothetical protein VGO06_27980 [Bosea sp. (in: a-proteobacteria)]|jgi:hypothetical protein|uniref:hypothetical protein n=1 Tax=Bosea sp. (in: a-proteobacteria) TaxID=1871050 RepID=UPI002E1556E0|nr:hypothetical protein [Bosea sp. (in: a-proteobacteria)]
MFDQYLTQSPLAQRAVQMEVLANRLAQSWPLLLPHLLEAVESNDVLRFAFDLHDELIRKLGDAAR